jgi:hypothetical protein
MGPALRLVSVEKIRSCSDGLYGLLHLPKDQILQKDEIYQILDLAFFAFFDRQKKLVRYAIY